MDPFIYYYDFEDCFQLDLSGNPLTYVVGSNDVLSLDAPYIINPIEEPNNRVCATYITASTSTAATHYTDVSFKYDDCNLCLEANGQVVNVTGILKPEISNLNLIADKRFKKGDIMHLNIVYDDSGTLMFINSPVIINETSVYTPTGSTIAQTVPFAPYSTFRQVIESKGVYYRAVDCSGGTETIFLSHQEIKEYGVIVQLPFGDSPCKKVLGPVTTGEYSLISGVTTVLRSSEVFTTCEDCFSNNFSSSIDETFSQVKYTADTISDFFDGEDSIILVGSGLTHAYSDKLINVGNIVEVKYDGTINTDFNKITFGSFTTNNDNYLYLSGQSIFDFSGDFTVEFWVNYSTGDTNAGFISYYDNDNEEGWQIRLDSTYLAFDYNSDSIVSSLEPTLGEWNHIAVVRDGSDLTIYLNGTGETTSSVSDTITVGNGISLKIGSNSSGNTFIDGYMASVRICQSTVYAGDFDPQTTPLTIAQGSFGNINSVDSVDTVLLLNFKSEQEFYSDDSQYFNSIYFKKVISLSTTGVQTNDATFETLYEGEPLRAFQEIELPDGFLINFFDAEYSSVFVNPNSYLTFGQGSNAEGLVLPQDIESEIGAPGIFISTLGSGNTDDNRTFIDKISTAFTDNGETFLVKVEGDYSVQPRMVLTQCMCNTIVNNSRVPLFIVYEVCTGEGTYHPANEVLGTSFPIGFSRAIVGGLGRTRVCAISGGAFRFFTATSFVGPPGCGSGGNSTGPCVNIAQNTLVSSTSLPSIFEDINILENGSCTEFLDTYYDFVSGGGTNPNDNYEIQGYGPTRWAYSTSYGQWQNTSWYINYTAQAPNNWVCGQGCSNNLVIQPYFPAQGITFQSWGIGPANDGGSWYVGTISELGFYNRWARFLGTGSSGPRLFQEDVFQFGYTYSIKFDVFINTQWCSSNFGNAPCCDSYINYIRVFAGSYSEITPGGGSNYEQFDFSGIDPTLVSGPHTYEFETVATGADLSFTARFNCNTNGFPNEGLYISNICVREIAEPQPPADICKCMVVNYIGTAPQSQYFSQIRWNDCDGVLRYAWLSVHNPNLQICVLNASFVILSQPNLLQVTPTTINCTGTYCQTPPCNCYSLKLDSATTVTYEDCSGAQQTLTYAQSYIGQANICARVIISSNSTGQGNIAPGIDANNGTALCPANCTIGPTPTPTPTFTPVPLVTGCVVVLQKSLPGNDGVLLYLYNVNNNTTTPLTLSGDTTGVRDIALSQAPTGRLYEILNGTNEVRYWNIDFQNGDGGGALVILNVPVVTGWEFIAQGLGVAPDGTTLWYSRQAMIGNLLTNRIYAYDTITQTNLPNFIQLSNGRTVWGDIIINSNNTKLFVLTRVTQTINGVAPSINFEQYDISNLNSITQECVFNLTLQNSAFSPASATDLDMFMTNGILYILRKSNQFGEQVWTLSQTGILSANPVQGPIPSFGSSGTIQGAASYPQCAVDVTGAPWECFDGLDERCLPLMVFPGLPVGTQFAPGSPANVGFWDFVNGTVPQLIDLDTAPAITYNNTDFTLSINSRTVDIAHTMDFNTNQGRMWILHSVGGNPNVKRIHEWDLTYVPGAGGTPDGFTTVYRRVISFPAFYRVGTGLAARTNTRLITTRYANTTTPNGPNVVIELDIAVAGNITLDNTTITDIINLPSAGQSFWTANGAVTLPSAPGTFVTYGDLMLTDNTNQLIIIGKLSTTTNLGLPNNLGQTTHTVLLQYNYVAGTYWPNFIRYYADTTATQQATVGTTGVDRSLVQYLNNLYLVRVINNTTGQQVFRVSQINTVNGNLTQVGNGIVPGTAGTGVGAFIGPYGSSSARRIGGTSTCGNMQLTTNVPGCRCHNISTVTGGQGQFIARRCDNFANQTFTIGGGAFPVSGPPQCFIQGSYQNLNNTTLASVGADCILCLNNTFICSNNCPSPTPTPTVTRTQTVTPTVTKTPTTTPTPTQTRIPILPNCCVLLNSTNSDNLWYYDVTSNTALQIYMPGGAGIAFRDIAISQTIQRYVGLLVPGGSVQPSIYRWNVNFQTGTLLSGPTIFTLNGVPSSYGEGLSLSLDANLCYLSRNISNQQNIVIYNLSLSAESTLFPLAAGRQVSGDIIVTSTGKLIFVSRDNNNLYIEQWTTNNTAGNGSQDGEFNLTQIDSSFTSDLEIDLFVHDSQLYLVKPDGNPESLWSITADGSSITEVDTLPSIGNIRGAASYPQCNIWEFTFIDPRCAPLYISYEQMPSTNALYPLFVTYDSEQVINFTPLPPNLTLLQHSGARGRIGIARTFDYDTDSGRIWIYHTETGVVTNGAGAHIDEWDYSFVEGTGFVIGNYRRRITVGISLNLNNFTGSTGANARSLGCGLSALDNNTLVGSRASNNNFQGYQVRDQIVTINIFNGGLPGNYVLVPGDITPIFNLPMPGASITTSDQGLINITEKVIVWGNLTVTDNQKIIIKAKFGPALQQGNGNHFILQIDLADNLEYAYVLDNTTSGPLDNRWNSVFLYDQQLVINRVTGAVGQWVNNIIDPSNPVFTNQLNTGGPVITTNSTFVNNGFNDESTPIFIGGVSVCPTIELPNNVTNFINP